MNKENGAASSAAILQEDEDALRLSVLSLHEENEKLREQVTTLVNTVRNSDQGMSNSSREVLERLLHKLEEKSLEGTAAGSPTIQMKVSELRGKEQEWERERASLRELISTLQEDRSYYKDTASKKEDEMAALRNEVLALQQQMLDLQRQEGGVTGGPRPSHRLPLHQRTHLRPGSTSASSSDTSCTAPGRRTQSSVRSTATKPRVPLNPVRSSATSSRSSQSSKASSEPRELPPKPSVSSTASSKTTTPSKTGSSSSGSALSKKEQQMATSARLASNKTPAARTPGRTAPPKKQPQASVRRTPASGAAARSASVAKAGARSANSARPVSSSCQSTSGSGRSTASSAASSKSNSQKGTPLSSPTKVQSSVVAKSTKPTASSTHKSSSQTNSVSSKGNKSSSSSSQSSRQSSKQNSTSSTPSRSLVASPSKMKSISGKSEDERSPRVSDRETAATIAMSAADADVLVALLRPEPHDSEEANDSSGKGGDPEVAVLCRQRTMTLSWDSGAGAAGDTDDSWGTSYRTRGVGAAGDDEESQSSSPKEDERLPSPGQIVEQKVSSESEGGPRPPLDRTVGSVAELQDLLRSHLHRQHKLDQLLQQPPRLVSTPSPKAHMTVRQVKGRKSHRRSPDGAEKTNDILETSLQEPVIKSPSKSYSSKSSKLPKSPAHRSSSVQSSSSEAKTPTSPSVSSPALVPPTLTKLSSPSKKSSRSKTMSRSSDSETSVASPGLVRQGTFNLDQSEAYIDKSQMGDGGEGCPLGEQGWLIEDEDEKEILSATIAAHISRMRQVQDLKE